MLNEVEYLEKIYGCLFTCLKIRALHLEISHSLSTESLLMAPSRFCGKQEVYQRRAFNDNGSYFVGAKAEI